MKTNSSQHSQNRNYRTALAALFLLVMSALSILLDITAGKDKRLPKPHLLDVIDRNITRDRRDEFKTILLWNTLFEDPTFGLR